MAWRFHGRARISPSNPQATAVCDSCKFTYNLVDLQNQVAWRGDKLMPTGFKKCPRCIDIPFIFNKPLHLPPDPIPVNDPRPEYFIPEVTPFRRTSSGAIRATMDGNLRITQPTGDIMLETMHG